MLIMSVLHGWLQTVRFNSVAYLSSEPGGPHTMREHVTHKVETPRNILSTPEERAGQFVSYVNTSDFFML